ncbi:MAG: hypothetical protein V1743_05585 [Nanoarchaeota archaeon]
MADRIQEIKELLRGFYTALNDFLKVKIDIPDDDLEIKKQYTSLHAALLLLETYQKGLNWQNTEDIEKKIKQTVRASRLSAIAVLHYLQDIPRNTPPDPFIEPTHRIGTIGDELILKLRG